MCTACAVAGVTRSAGAAHLLRSPRAVSGAAGQARLPAALTPAHLAGAVSDSLQPQPGGRARAVTATSRCFGSVSYLISGDGAGEPLAWCVHGRGFKKTKGKRKSERKQEMGVWLGQLQRETELELDVVSRCGSSGAGDEKQRSSGSPGSLSGSLFVKVALF